MFTKAKGYAYFNTNTHTCACTHKHTHKRTYTYACTHTHTKCQSLQSVKVRHNTDVKEEDDGCDDDVGVTAGVATDGAQEVGGGEPDVYVHDQLRVGAAGDQEKCFCLHSGNHTLINPFSITFNPFTTEACTAHAGMQPFQPRHFLLFSSSVMGVAFRTGCLLKYIIVNAFLMH